jgi:hypothetical protein
MAATKDEIAAAIRTAREQIEELVSSAPEGAWSSGVYQNGWNAKQVLCHLAITAGIPSLLIGMAKAPRPTVPQPSPDTSSIDAANERMVESLMALPIDDIVAQIRRNYDRGLADLEGAPDGLLSQEMRTPWGSEGKLGDILLAEDLREHAMVHIGELARAVR